MLWLKCLKPSYELTQIWNIDALTFHWTPARIRKWLALHSLVIFWHAKHPMYTKMCLFLQLYCNPPTCVKAWLEVGSSHPQPSINFAMQPCETRLTNNCLLAIFRQEQKGKFHVGPINQILSWVLEYMPNFMNGWLGIGKLCSAFALLGYARIVGKTLLLCSV